MAFQPPLKGLAKHYNAIDVRGAPAWATMMIRFMLLAL
jgi:hypothetical protein